MALSAQLRYSPAMGTADDIRAWRERLGLSQQQAADKLGIPAGTLRNWEQGRYKPLWPLLERACKWVEDRAR